MDKNDSLLRSFRFKKSLGQNFITDESLLSEIAEAAEISGAKVLEIGVGAATLTKALSERAKKVVGVEIDASLEPVIAERLGQTDNAEIIYADFMKLDLKGLEKKLGRYSVVANLPYYLTSPIIMRLVEDSESCEKIVVMVQSDVADRLCAEAGTAEYGAITAAINAVGETTRLMEVPRQMFYPVPNVDSTVVKISINREKLPVLDRGAYRTTVRLAFSSRRKTLENNLISGLGITRDRARELLTAAGVKEGVRGETLDAAMFAKLSNLLFSEGVIKK